MKEQKGHPWGDFLAARARVIDWLYYRFPDGPCHHSDAQIAQTLSMDEAQVYLIRTRDEREGSEGGSA